MLMTADEKIDELQHIVDVKNNENDQLKVQGPGRLPQQDIQAQINAAMQDL